MPFNGSGGFTRVMNWQADAAAGTKIKADRHDQEDDNFASGLGNVICKDGQSSPTADIPFNAKKITNLANPVNPQDGATKAYVDAEIPNKAITNMVMTVVTSSSTYTKPAGLKFLLVEVQGGGGGSGGVAATVAGQYGASGGGGGGGYCRSLLVAASIAATVSMTVGASGGAGVGSSHGAAGGASSFGSLSSGGGGGGTTTGVVAATAYAAPGSGGTATGGQVNLPGGRGSNGIALLITGAGWQLGGSGGSTPLGFGGAIQIVGNNPSTGQSGYGSGAGGGVLNSSQPAMTGGAGGAGVIILTEYF